MGLRTDVVSTVSSTASTISTASVSPRAAQVAGLFWQGSCRQENALAGEGEACTADHQALEHLDAVDVSLDDARVPGEGEAGDDGVTVAVDARCESVEAGAIVVTDAIESVGQPPALVRGEEVRI